MKKVLILVMAVVMVVLCASCSKQSEKTEEMIKYSIYNRTGEEITELSLEDSRSSNKATVAGIAAGEDCELGLTVVLEKNAPDITLNFSVANGSQYMTKILQKDVPITLLPIASEGDIVSFTKPQE